MDFALKILGKYGWKEGEGLGKNSNGIAKPLKATLKFDNAGFGADQAAADFNNHWWERVFNEAADNVDVKQEGDTIKMDLNNEESVEISTKGYSMKKLKKAKRKTEKDVGNRYDNFLQAATLTNLGGEVENPNKIELSDIEVTKVKVLTDEELFMACGGRTAHKGARHGLKLSGKLSRIALQEEELLAKMLAKRKGVENAHKCTNEKLTQQKAVKMESLEEEVSIKKSKKKKKSKKLEESKEISPMEACDPDQIESNKLKRKRKKKHCDKNYVEQTTSLETTEENTIEIDTSSGAATKKKKKKNKERIV